MNSKSGLSMLFLLFIAVNNCIYHDVKAPGPVTQITQYNLNTDDYKILGKVEESGVIRNYFLIFSSGGQGYAELLKKAAEMGGDDVINYKFELQSSGWFLLVYNEIRWKAFGTVIKYTDRAKK